MWQNPNKQFLMNTKEQDLTFLTVCDLYFGGIKAASYTI